MNPDLLLRVLAAFADYLMKTTLAFGLVFFFSRLLYSPARRLAVWLSFLLGVAGYWLWLGKDVFEGGRYAAKPSLGVLQPVASAAGVWHLQRSWALPLAMTMRVAGI